MVNAIENSISNAVKKLTPDVLPEILLRLEKQEGETENMESASTVKLPNNVLQLVTTQEKTKRRSWAKWAAGISAAFVLLVGAYVTHANFIIDSVVGFDVNPSIQLTVNRNEKILSATPMNADAKIILEDMDLKNVSLDVAVNALIGSMLKNGYVTEIANSILISVENSDAEKAAALEQKLTNEVAMLLDACAIDSSVISQSYTGKDTSINTLAQEYNITYGKAELVSKLVRLDETLNFADVAKLSVNEIKLLVEGRQAQLEGVTSKGNASSAAYVGESAARQKALQHAGVTASEATFIMIRLDFDDGRMVYEMEFYTGNGSYECDVDALTGTVVAFERENIRQPASPNNADTKHDNDASAGQIGIDAAKTAALKHAGLTASQVNFEKAELDCDDGRYVYDITFYSGSYEYNFEIDATTGAILDYDKESEGNPPSTDALPYAPSPSPSSDCSPQTSTGQIGIDAAKTAALKHAGLTASQVTFEKAELDCDDGQCVYEIDFKSGDMEYEYEIDAITGSILKAESEQDD